MTVRTVRMHHGVIKLTYVIQKIVGLMHYGMGCAQDYRLGASARALWCGIVLWTAALSRTALKPS